MDTRKPILLALLPVILACLCQAQNDLVPKETLPSIFSSGDELRTSERHIQADPARELYQRSIFAHGYIHGYEDGFHVGDLDFQTAHAPRDVREIKLCRDATNGYRREFGKREDFRTAYRQGFSAGYNDAISDREFRAVAAARRAGNGLSDVILVRGRANDIFDRGFRQGYESGRINGEVAGRDQSGYNARPAACTPDARLAPRLPAQLGKSGRSRGAGPGADFCDGYARGYAMGYDDGYLVHGLRPEPNVTAKKR